MDHEVLRRTLTPDGTGSPRPTRLFPTRLFAGRPI
jgi:hypothetical protein